MSHRKRNANHLFLSEPQHKFTKFNFKNKFQNSELKQPVQITYTPSYPPQNIKMESAVNKIVEKLQFMEKQIQSLEKQTQIQAEYIDKLEHRNQSRMDDMSQLVNRIQEMEIEKRKYNVHDNSNTRSNSNKLPHIKYDMSYIS